MIKIEIAGSADGRKRGFTIKGHSGYAPAGQDIICAGVSILGQTAIAALNELTDVDIEYTINEEQPCLKCMVQLPEDVNREDYIRASAILDSFEIGCRYTSECYGKKYIKLLDTTI